MRLFHFAILLVVTPRIFAADSSDIGAPRLGFLYDIPTRSFRQISGVPGAATLEPGMRFGFTPDRVVIAGQKQYVLATGSDDEFVRILLLAGSDLTTRILDGVLKPSRVVLSPSDLAGAFYHDVTGRVQIVTGLPDSPKLIHEFSITNGTGAVTALAVSDDGHRVLAAAGPALWIFDQDSGLSSITADARIADVCFRSGSHDAFIVLQSGQILAVDSKGVLLPFGPPLSSGTASPIAIRVSANGSRGYIAFDDGTLAVVSSQAETPRRFSCDCTPIGLEPLSAPGFYRINESSTDTPLLLLDVSRDIPRLWFVPTSDAGNEGTNR
jgi:hypothetical protein